MVRAWSAQVGAAIGLVARHQSALKSGTALHEQHRKALFEFSTVAGGDIAQVERRSYDDQAARVHHGRTSGPKAAEHASANAPRLGTSRPVPVPPCELRDLRSSLPATVEVPAQERKGPGKNHDVPAQLMSSRERPARARSCRSVAAQFAAGGFPGISTVEQTRTCRVNAVVFAACRIKPCARSRHDAVTTEGATIFRNR